MDGSGARMRGTGLAWSFADLRRALLRRANFDIAGKRCRRSGKGLAHAGVSRRAIRRLGHRAAVALARSGRMDTASDLTRALMAGRYHDEQMLALEIMECLTDLWPNWAIESVAHHSRSLRHPWVADRLAQVQGRLLTRMPLLLSKHAHWAVSPNPLRRRAAAVALLPHGTSRRYVPAARALPILRLLLGDPEPHPWVRQAVGRSILFYSQRAPRTISPLLGHDPAGMPPRHLERARLLLDRVASAS